MNRLVTDKTLIAPPSAKPPRDLTDCIEINKPLAQPYAAIDIGAGKARLIIRRPDANGILEEVCEIPVPCKVAKGISLKDKKPIIQPDNYEALLAAMRQFREILAEQKVLPQNTIAVGTEAFRIIASRNPALADFYAEKISAELGHRFIVLTGKEEARTNAYTAKIEYDRAGYCGHVTDIFNIGGGSSQGSSLTSRGKVKFPYSVSLGAETLKKECKGNITKAYGVAKRRLAAAAVNHPSSYTKLSVLGGGARSLRHILCEDVVDYTLRGQSLIAGKMAHLVAITSENYANYVRDNIHDRADDLPWVAAILKARIDLGRPEEVSFLGGTMCEGLIDIFYRVDKGVIVAPPPGLERLFAPSAPSPSLHA